MSLIHRWWVWSSANTALTINHLTKIVNFILLTISFKAFILALPIISGQLLTLKHISSSYLLSLSLVFFPIFFIIVWVFIPISCPTLLLSLKTLFNCANLHLIHSCKSPLCQRAGLIVDQPRLKFCSCSFSTIKTDFPYPHLNYPWKQSSRH